MATHLDFYRWVREDFGWRDDFEKFVAFDSLCDDGRVDLRIKNEWYGIFARRPTPENPQRSPINLYVSRRNFGPKPNWLTAYFALMDKPH